MSLLPVRVDALSEALTVYCNQPYFFPLIGAVLTGAQKGIAFTDSDIHPKRWYVEHSFGFSQIFGEPSSSFDLHLRRYLFIEKSFRAPKVRLYGTEAPPFFYESKCLQAERQRFELNRELFEVRFAQEGTPQALTFLDINLSNVHVVEKQFGVTSRFWPTPKDFVERARSVVALLNGNIAAICYAAAHVKQFLEIDVCTLPEFRRKGVAHATVSEFVKRSLHHKLEPLWDCFTNNAGSVALCNSLGFVAKGNAYPFFTIER